MRHFCWKYVVVFLISSTCGVCQAEDAEINIFAAASLQNAVSELADRYAKESSTKIHISVAGTSTLARQIEYGAPAHIFISANKGWVDYLVDKQAINPTSVSVIAKNSLTLVAPINSVDTPSLQQPDWDETKLFSIAMVDAVPAGIYAKEALIYFGHWDHLQSNLIQTDNVRSALHLVELGQVDYGLVYASDAFASKKVNVIEELPGTSHSPIEYHVALVGTNVSSDALQFYDLMKSSVFKSILRKNGFVVP